jgi:hypothetical protein
LLSIQNHRDALSFGEALQIERDDHAAFALLIRIREYVSGGPELPANSDRFQHVTTGYRNPVKLTLLVDFAVDDTRPAHEPGAGAIPAYGMIVSSGIGTAKRPPQSRTADI